MHSKYSQSVAQLRGLELYWKTRRLLKKSQGWNHDESSQYQFIQLRNMLQHCANNVPYYRKLFRATGFAPARMRYASELAGLPTLEKEIVRSQTVDLLAENIPRSSWNYYTTGGTMGKPLGLYGLKGGGWRERAFIETM